MDAERHRSLTAAATILLSIGAAIEGAALVLAGHGLLLAGAGVMFGVWAFWFWHTHTHAKREVGTLGRDAS